MGWMHLGGGYYKNEETGEKIRGKDNLPVDDTGDVGEISATELPCMTCNKLTVHIQQPINSIEWAVYNCKECGGKTRVSLK